MLFRFCNKHGTDRCFSFSFRLKPGVTRLAFEGRRIVKRKSKKKKLSSPHLLWEIIFVVPELHHNWIKKEKLYCITRTKLFAI